MKELTTITIVFLLVSNLTSQTSDAKINEIVHKYKDEYESANDIVDLKEHDLLNEFQYEMAFLLTFAEDLLYKTTVEDAFSIYDYLEKMIRKRNDPELDEYIFMIYYSKFTYFYDNELNKEAREVFKSIEKIIERSSEKNSPELQEFISTYNKLLDEQEKEIIAYEKRRVEREKKRAKKAELAKLEDEEDQRYDQLMEYSMRMMKATESIGSGQERLENELQIEEYKSKLHRNIGKSHKNMDEFNAKLVKFVNRLTFSELNFVIEDLVNVLAYNIEFVNSNYSKNEKLATSLFSQVSSLNDIRNRHRIALTQALQNEDQSVSSRWRNECTESKVYDSKEEMFLKLVEQMEVTQACAKLEKKIYANQNLKPINLYQFDKIQKVLQDNEVIIIFNRLNLSNGKIGYGALIADNKSKNPKWVTLDSKIDLEKQGFEFYLKALKVQNDDSTYRHFFSKIDKLVPNAKKLYIVSDGVYHKINLATLYDSDSKMYLIDKYKIVYIRDVGNLKESDILVLKDEDFSLFGISQFQFKSKNVNLTKYSFPDLPYVKNEIEIISEKMKRIYKIDISLDENQSKRHLKNLVNPSVIHISTHGYFLPRIVFSDEDGSNEDLIIQEDNDLTINVKDIANSDADDFKIESIDELVTLTNPFLQSGLVLDSGDYLSSNSISGLRLAKTKLVTLSACHSNRGALISGQSSFGIKNSFLMTGVDYVLSSTHKVGDFETLEFMNFFYDKLSQGFSIVESYNLAVNYLKSDHSIISPSKPNVWGAFTLERGYSD